MRRAIQVFGAELDSGKRISTEDDGVVSVTVHPDKSVTYTDPTGARHNADGHWTSYIPRFN